MYYDCSNAELVMINVDVTYLGAGWITFDPTNRGRRRLRQYQSPSYIQQAIQCPAIS
jgi:hypothetical protein